MTKELDNAAIVRETKKKFGHHSDAVANATSLHDVAVALRALASANERTNARLCNEVLNFQKKHRLQGLYEESR